MSNGQMAPETKGVAGMTAAVEISLDIVTQV